MIKVLANDGISQSGIDALNEAGIDITTVHVAQEQLAPYINDNDISVLLVRSATTARKELIDACPGLKIIGRGGVGMDNIDVAYAREKGLQVINTPAASSHSVAELVFAHLFGCVRFLHQANRNMPLEGDTNFKNLKKAYAKKAVAQIAVGCGMKVIYHDQYVPQADIGLSFFDGQEHNFSFTSIAFDDLLMQSDFITLHVPAQDAYVIGADQLAKMKPSAGLINAARGGVVDEPALLAALDAKQIAFAALDVFEKEPAPDIQVLMHEKISFSPHIGAATQEAQDRIGTELAAQIIALS